MNHESADNPVEVDPLMNATKIEISFYMVCPHPVQHQEEVVTTTEERPYMRDLAAIWKRLHGDWMFSRTRPKPSPTPVIELAMSV